MQVPYAPSAVCTKTRSRLPARTEQAERPEEWIRRGASIRGQGLGRVEIDVLVTLLACSEMES